MGCSFPVGSESAKISDPGPIPGSGNIFKEPRTATLCKIIGGMFPANYTDPRKYWISEYQRHQREHFSEPRTATLCKTIVM